MKICIIYFILLSLIQPCRGVEFRNLDFQSPNVRRITERFGLVRDIIPGWQLQIGEQGQDWMFYNNVCLICPSATLYGPEVPKSGDAFSFVMKSGFLLGVGTMAAVSIYQVGEIPESSRSIRFQANMFPNDSYLHVSMDGQALSSIRTSNGDLFRYEADISSWAGKTGELRFTVGPGSDLVGGTLADIEFSSIPVSPIPEPSTWAMLATGLAALGWAARNSKQRPAN